MRWAAIGLVALLLAAGALWWRDSSRSEESPPTAVVARSDVVISVSALGKIGPKSFVDVGAQVSGQLDAVHVAIGDRVQQGDLLAQIDPRVYQSRVEADRARVQSLQAQLAEREAGLTLARSTHARNTSVAARGLVAREVLDTSAAALGQAEAQVRSVQAQLEEARSTLAGDVANLGYARIYAPMAGTVVSQTVLEGQTLNASQVAPTLLRIADLATMTVTAQVAEADIVRIREGMPAWFTTLGQPQRRWTGTVRQRLPTPDIVNDVVLYKVLVDVENGDGALLPDMTAQVFFEIEAARDALTLPAAVLSGTGPGDTVRVDVLDASGRITPRDVRIGLRERERVQVVAGLEEGEQVVIPSSPEGPARSQRPGLGLFGGPRR